MGTINKNTQERKDLERLILNNLFFDHENVETKIRYPYEFGKYVRSQYEENGFSKKLNGFVKNIDGVI